MHPNPKSCPAHSSCDAGASDRKSKKTSTPSTPSVDTTWPFPKKLITCKPYTPTKQALREEAIEDGDPPW